MSWFDRRPKFRPTMDILWTGETCYNDIKMFDTHNTPWVIKRYGMGEDSITIKMMKIVPIPNEVEAYVNESIFY